MLCIVSSCCHPKRIFLCEEKVMSGLEASVTINVVAVQTATVVDHKQFPTPADIARATFTLFLNTVAVCWFGPLINPWPLAFTFLYKSCS